MDIIQTNRSRLFLVVGAAALIIVAIAVGAGVYLYSKKGGSGPSQNQAEEKSLTKAPVPEDVKVPETTDPNAVPEGVAVPKAITDAAVGVAARERLFEITAQNQKFTPSEIIVREGDTVRINFKAVDDTYDLTLPDYGLKQTAKEGETKLLLFQALSSGDFTFYCEACGGLKSSAVGHLIVVKR